ncbi:MAG TPA: TIR domain-containing protein [Albitalea sp.]|uniref:TIR domain-containing protein n=1 Tax=Piscinibacter sp. TaxID=1903157 RepID=UPI002ED325E0
MADVLVRLKRASVFISGPDGTGTGYLVAPKRIGTALHVVQSWQPGERHAVIVGVGGPTCQATLLKSDPATDAAVLAFDESIDVEPLAVAGDLVRNVAWEGYGFPAVAGKQASPSGLPLDGQVKDPSTLNNVGQPAVLLYSDQVAAGNASPLHGFSGSPVLVDGGLVGHLTKHIGDADDKRRAVYGYVYACPIEAVVKLLDVPPFRTEIAPDPLQTVAESIPQIDATGYHVFVSYRSTDRAWATSLVTRLEGAGLRVFMDQRELKAGDYLAAQLESGLQRSRAAVVLVSKGWLESPWCQQEANVLIQRAVEDKDFKLIPLRLDDSAMPPLLNSRLWLDFKGSARAAGKPLDRLLSALVDREPPRPASPVARADAAVVRVTDKFVAEVKAAARGGVDRIEAVVAEWRKTASDDMAPLIAAAQAYIDKGEYEAALALLDEAPALLRSRQLRALALGKMKRLDDAIALLEALRDEGQLDPETGGLLGGRYKERWLQQRDNAFRLLSYQVYRETYERAGDPFNGINTAAMALQNGDMATMFQVIAKVRADLLARDVASLDHWDLATVGETYLLEKRLDDARDWYARAAGKAAGLHQAIAVMRKQARLDLQGLGEPQDRLDAVLPVPCVLAYFGHMVDAPGRVAARLPAEKVGALRNTIQGRIEKYGALHGFGQAARGTDLIVLEELVKRDLTATVVLPFPAEDFILSSVTDPKWIARFNKLRGDKQHVTFTAPLEAARPADALLPEAFAAANREIQRRAIEYARRLDQKPIVLAVWDGKEGDGPGGTADAVALWRDEGYEVDVIDVAKL